MTSIDLSLLVAVHIMGWRQDPVSRHWAAPGDDDFTRHSDEVTMYANDIFWAMRVLDKLTDDGYRFTLINYPEPKTPYMCALHDGVKTITAVSAYMEEAICLAALKMKGIEIDSN